MTSLANLDRSTVLAAMKQADELGEAAFLEAHGFGASKVYRVAHAGRSYPSKAIVGAALGLTSREFFGGVAQVVPALLREGFTVTRNGRRVASVGLEALAAAGKLDDADRLPALPVQPAAVFASGSNRPGEVRGFASVGHDIGVAAPELNREAIAALVDLAGSDVNVFVDSGAFSEVRWGENGREVVAPITPAEWTRRLELYRELAAALGSQVWLVAPDAVGDQRETLERLERYAPQVRELEALGARVLVPMQGGELSPADFAAAVDAALGFATWTPAVPCKKAAASPEDVAAIVAVRSWSHVHLLGLGPKNRRVAEYLAPFTADGAPSVSLDSCWITANVGRGGRKPRRYTRARDAAKALLGASATAARVAELALLVAWAAL